MKTHCQKFLATLLLFSHTLQGLACMNGNLLAPDAAGLKLKPTTSSPAQHQSLHTAAGEHITCHQAKDGKWKATV